jgi:hypothetical protein
MDFMPMAALNGELSPIAGVVSISIVADLLTQNFRSLTVVG